MPFRKRRYLKLVIGPSQTHSANLTKNRLNPFKHVQLLLFLASGTAWPQSSHGSHPIARVAQAHIVYPLVAGRPPGHGGSNFLAQFRSQDLEGQHLWDIGIFWGMLDDPSNSWEWLAGSREWLKKCFSLLCQGFYLIRISNAAILWSQLSQIIMWFQIVSSPSNLHRSSLEHDANAGRLADSWRSGESNWGCWSTNY